MLQFQVNGQNLTLSQTSQNEVVCGAREFVRFCVSFSEEWDGYFTVVRFRREGGEAYEVADVRAGREYFVPYEVLQSAGAFYVTCLGVKGERSLATVSRLRVDVSDTDLPQEAVRAADADPTLLSALVRALEEKGKELSLAPLVFRTTDTHLQYKYAEEEEALWRNFLELSEIRGPKGERGEKGERGAKGDVGPQGVQGLQGIRGETGEKGDRGETGKTGAKGEAGFGMAEVWDADANDLNAAGVYACYGNAHRNFPLPAAGNSVFFVLVQKLQNEQALSCTYQTLFLMEPSMHGLRVYSRQFDFNGSGAWGEWTDVIHISQNCVKASQLSEEVCKKVPSYNLFNPALSGIVRGLLNEEGKVTSNNYYSTTPFLSVAAGNYVYRRLHTTSLIMCGAFYNSAHKFVFSFGSFEASSQNAFAVQFETDGYVRLSFRNSDTYPHYHMFAKGDLNTPFLPYNLGAELFSGQSVGLGEGLQMDIEQVAVGRYNAFTRGGRTHQSAFVVGNGAGEDNRSNALRIDYRGRTYAAGAYNSTGADYAEYFEWADGNPNAEDRTGRLVCLQGDKIALCEEGEFPFGIISAAASVVGDAATDAWHGKYQKDVFGRILFCEDANGRLVPRLSEEYDPTRPYVSREERAEWASVGLVGKLVLTDDGTLSPGDSVASMAGGVGTKAQGYTPFYCMRRLDERHVLVFVK